MYILWSRCGSGRWFNSKEAQAQQKILDGSRVTLTEPQVQGSGVPYRQVFHPEQIVAINDDDDDESVFRSVSRTKLRVL